MIDDENHPEWVAVTRALSAQVNAVFQRHGFNRRAVELAQQLCDSCTTKARQHGLRYPDMIVVYIKSKRYIAIYDREATHDKKQQYIVNLVRAGVTDPVEIAAAFRRAWPDYSPHIEEKLATLRGRPKFPAQ